MPPIPKEVIDGILEQIGRGLCVPFLGSGASAKTEKKDGFLMGGELASRMLERLAQKGINGTGISNPENLPEVATHYELFLNRHDLVTFLRESFPDEQIDPLPIHDALAKLPFDLIITTNYDTLIEKAFGLAKRQTKRVIQPRGGFKEASTPASLFAYKTGTIVYKMHGCLSDNDDNFIVTEDDYWDMLSYMHKKDEGIPTLITGRFGVSTLLFLGYGLSDVDFKVLHKVIEKFPDGNRPQSYAIQKSSSAFAKQYWGKKGILIYDVDVHEFMNALLEAYEAKKK